MVTTRPTSVPNSQPAADPSPWVFSPAPDDETPSAPAAPSATPPRPDLYREEELMAALAAPREGGLGHVLETMQPDQYELVTWPDDLPLVVQGYPGTGKTIVALHRAAYLVSADQPSGHRHTRVVLLGPTANYVRHTRPALSGLEVDGAVELISVPELLRRIYPALSNDGESTSALYQDNARMLGRFVDKAAALVEKNVGLASAPSPEVGARRIYESLRALGQARLTRIDARWSDYLAKLPQFDDACRQPRFHSLVAACALASMPEVPQIFDHLVVDEAQDVTPLVWYMLRKINRRDRWTVVGDMNQRSWDWSLPTWVDVTSTVGIDLDAGDTYQEFRTVYRSTRGILAFANALLPDAGPEAFVVDDDSERPSLIKYPMDELHAGIVTEIEGLYARHPEGTVAVIGTDLTLLRGAVRDAGFQPNHDSGELWTRDHLTVRLLLPAESRGLEFDGVVVVEPGSFPKSDGSEGPLYTSLTRASRQLVVVHSRGVPAGLRRAARGEPADPPASVTDRPAAAPHLAAAPAPAVPPPAAPDLAAPDLAAPRLAAAPQPVAEPEPAGSPHPPFGPPPTFSAQPPAAPPVPPGRPGAPHLSVAPPLPADLPDEPEDDPTPH